MKHAFLILALLVLLPACCRLAPPNRPNHYAYSSARQMLKQDASTYNDALALYGEPSSRESQENGNYVCTWTYSKTVLKSTEQRLDNAPYDPALKKMPNNVPTVYTSTLTATFSKDNVLKNFSVIHKENNK